MACSQPVVPQRAVDEGKTLAEKFLIRWKGEADPKHVHAIDAYWSSAAEHGMNASTFTARVITSTGADVAAAFSGAIGAMSGPLHGGAPSRVLGMIEEVERRDGDAASYVKELLDDGERLMGFGHRVYRAEDPRARVLRRTARELDAPRYEVAEALEQAALAELRERRPDRVLETNVEFWAAIVLDFAEVPAHMFTSMFTCARTGGWSAHILEQKRTGRLIRPVRGLHRPSARPASRSTAGATSGPSSGLTGRSTGVIAGRYPRTFGCFPARERPSRPWVRPASPRTTGSRDWYQLVRPRAPALLSDTCTWSRWRSVLEHFLRFLQDDER